MKKFILFSLILVLLSSCTHQNEQNSEELTLGPNQKLAIQNFAVDFVADLNAYRYSMMRESWSDELFIERIGELTRTQKTVFNAFWKESWSKEVTNANIEIVNLLKYNQGKVHLSRIEDHESYFIINISLLLNESVVVFLSYRVEYQNDNIVLTDFRDLKTGLWLSANFRNLMQLSTQYTSLSEERDITYSALGNSQRALRDGDTLNALKFLSDVHPSHVQAYNIPLRRIEIAQFLPDDIYYSVLTTESIEHQCLYFDYLLATANGDIHELESVQQKLIEATGEEIWVDSLFTFRYYWN